MSETLLRSTARSSAYLIALLGVLTAVDAFAIDVLIPAMPQLRSAFAITAGQAGATISVFVAGLALGQLLYGPLSDRWGRKPPLVAGCALFVLGSLLPLIAPTLFGLLAGRLLQAIGASAGMVVSRAIVVDRFAEADSARVFSTLMQILGAATIVAPLLGGYLAQVGGWRAIFWLMAVLGSLCLAAVLFTLEETHQPEPTAAAWSARWRDLAALLTHFPFVADCLAMGCTLAGMFAVLVGNAFIFVDTFGWSAMTYAIVYAGGSLGFVVAGALNSRALRRFNPAQILLWSMTVVAAMAGAFWWLEAVDAAAPVAVAILTMTQLALTGFVFSNLGSLAMNRARHAAGTGSSLLGLAQYAISAAAAPVAAAIGGGSLHSTAVTAALFYGLGLLLFLASSRVNPPLRTQ